MANLYHLPVVSTALPTIVHELQIGRDYIWIVNAFVLTSTAFLPIIGQLADSWGRRWLTIGSVAIFTLGSGICGGASTGTVLIVGRAIQGLGSGGLNMLIDLIICDLVPLRDRGKFIGIINVFFAIGLFLGPFIGGAIVEHSNWRWVFWINLPIGGVSILLLVAFLQVKYVKAPLTERLGRIDYVGNLLVIGATTSVLYALTYAGTEYAWSDGHILAPLIVGILGMVAFHVFEYSPFPRFPTIPPRLFANRTSAVSFFITFIHALMTLWALYFLPVYFQAVQLATPSRSGIRILPTVFGMLPAAVISGQYLARTGKYKLLHIVGMFLMAAGMGSFAALDATSSMAMWVCLQLLASLGNGIVATSILPGVQAGLTDDDNAVSTAAWAFVRSYGAIWGVTIPATVFNNIFARNVWKISDPAAQAVLVGGNAYAYAARDFVLSFPAAIQSQIIEVYTHALRISWAVSAAIAGFAAFFTFFEVDIPLRATLRTEFGIKEPKQPADKEPAI